jgi:small-conductance mechanosensitive channel
VLGVPLDRLTLVVSALGVGIGFGLQNIVNNFVSGVILLFERPIRVGDLIQLEGLFGHVSTIGIRASKVRTFDGSDVIVPNGDLVSARVTNWTLADKKRRIDFPVGVAYGTDPTRVLEILLQIAKEHPEVLEHPEPEALFRSFGDSSLDFALRCWTESDRGLFAVQSDLAVGINAALAEAGIEIPFPQRDLHLRSVDPAIHSATPQRDD